MFDLIFYKHITTVINEIISGIDLHMNDSAHQTWLLNLKNKSYNKDEMKYHDKMFNLYIIQYCIYFDLTNKLLQRNNIFSKNPQIFTDE